MADSTEPATLELLRGQPTPGEPPDIVAGKSPYQAELEHFVRCVVTGEEPVVEARDAYEALRIGLAATESILSGRPVTLGGVG